MIKIDFENVKFHVTNAASSKPLSKVSKSDANAIMLALVGKDPKVTKTNKDFRICLGDRDKNDFPISLEVEGKSILIEAHRKYFVDDVDLSKLPVNCLKQALKALLGSTEGEQEFVYENNKFNKQHTMIRLRDMLNYCSDHHLERFPLCLQSPTRPTPCNMPGCSCEVRAGCTYCHNYHYASEVVWNERCNFEKLGGPDMSFRLQLCDILLQQLLGTNDGKRNKLQPGDCKLIVPRDFKDCLELLEYYEPLYKAYSALHEPKVDGSESPVLQDQRYRATFLAYTLGDNSVIRLMFGYEGFFITFLKQVRLIHGDRRLKSLKVEVVDIDKNVTNWHTRMLRCRNISCCKADIYSHWMIESTCECAPMHDYLNFCGVGGDSGWEKTVKFLKSEAQQRPLLLSFSTARSAAKKDYEASLKATSGGSDWRVQKLHSFRKDFVTYCIFPSDQHSQYDKIMDHTERYFQSQSNSMK